MTAVSLSFECCLVFARLSFDRRSTVVRPSLSTGNELECKGTTKKWNMQGIWEKNVIKMEKTIIN